MKTKELRAAHIRVLLPKGQKAFIDSQVFECGNFSSYSALVGFGLNLLYDDLVKQKAITGEPFHLIEGARFTAPKPEYEEHLPRDRKAQARALLEQLKTVLKETEEPPQ